MTDINRLDTVEYNAKRAHNFAENNHRRIEKIEADLSKVVEQTALTYEYLIGNTKEDGLKYVILRWGEKIEANEKSIGELGDSVDRLAETKSTAHRNLWIALSIVSVLATLSFALSLSQAFGG